MNWPDPAAQRVDEWITPHYGYSLAGVEWLEDRQTALQHLQIGRHPGFGTFLRLDGAFQCSEADEFFYHEPLVHTAMLLAARHERVAVIGGGDGGAAEEILKWPSVRRLDHVEIDAEVLACCRRHLGSVHRGVLDGRDARHCPLVGDGRAWLASDERAGTVDVLVLDLTDPGGPSAALHDESFYRSCQRALAPGGVMTLHIAAPWAQQTSCTARVALLQRVFGAVLPWQAVVPMSGGAWLMAACGEASLSLPAQPAVRLALRGLSGPRLRALSAEVWERQFALPPYLSEAFAEAIAARAPVLRA